MIEITTRSTTFVRTFGTAPTVMSAYKGVNLLGEGRCADNPWWIGPSVQVNSIGTAALLKGNGAWRVEGDINEALTGFTRNHNAGLVRTWGGSLPERDSLSVVFTDSCSSLPTVDNPDWSTATCDSLFSYDLWEIEGSLE